MKLGDWAEDPTLTIDLGTTALAHAFMEWFFDNVDCDAEGVDMHGGSNGSVVRIQFSGLELST